MNIKHKKKYMVHAYKYNGWLYRVVEYPYFLYETKDILCLYLPGQNIHSIKSEENTKKCIYYSNGFDKYWFFFKNQWFNIIVNVFEDTYSFYVNIASPYFIEEQAIKYIDFDIDFRIQSNGAYKILDENELIANAKKWNYSQKLIIQIYNTKDKIIELINSGWFKKIFNSNQLLYAKKMVWNKFNNDPELKKYLKLQKLKNIDK